MNLNRPHTARAIRCAAAILLFTVTPTVYADPVADFYKGKTLT